MKTMNELKQESTEYFIENKGTSEFDMSINDISRMQIEAMKREIGQCWLGKINLYGDERKKEYHLIPYIGQMVYNFDYDFCLPFNDDIIQYMIQDRDRTPYTGAIDDYKRLNKIQNRIDELGGELLFRS